MSTFPEQRTFCRGKASAARSETELMNMAAEHSRALGAVILAGGDDLRLSSLEWCALLWRQTRRRRKVDGRRS
jgi:hypothetical protein